MNEASEQESKLESSRGDKSTKMSFGEKLFFWNIPLLLTLWSLPFVLTSVLELLWLVAKARGLVAKDSGLHSTPLAETLVLWVSPLLAATLLYFASAIISKMIRRKRTTGSLLPMGEELKAVRKRERLWGRILVLVVFYWFSISFTVRAFSVPDPTVSGCVFVAIIWLLAIFITVSASRTSPPMWLGAVNAVLSSFTALYSTIHALTNQQDRHHWLFFSALMWATTASFTFDVLRSSAKKRAHVIP